MTLISSVSCSNCEINTRCSSISCSVILSIASRNILIIDILQALSDLLDQFINDLRRDILRTEDSRIILNEAHNDMMKSLITRDKRLASEAINKHFGIIDEKLRDKERKTAN
jgi:GntR family transcriptional repressor for pyruvate dehydrogenase complex